MTPLEATTRERSLQELILRMIERQMQCCLWDPRLRRVTHRMTTPCGRGRIAISIGSVLPHQEIIGSLGYDRMERCQVWQEIPQMPALQLTALRASMKVKEMQ